MDKDEALVLLGKELYVEVYRKVFSPSWADGLQRLIPERMHGGIIRWVCFGIRPGNFLSAVVDGDLFEAVGRADDENKEKLADYVAFFYNYAPSGCFRAERAKDWKGVYHD